MTREEKQLLLIDLCEDYVSLETAKLLKEKGFDGECSRFYMPNGNGRWKYEHYYDFDISDRIDCPTLQMAMKWLRKVHNFYVDPCPCVEGDYWNNKWNVYVCKLMNRYPFLQFIGVCNTYEEACEAAIKYCLENLI